MSDARILANRPDIRSSSVETSPYKSRPITFMFGSGLTMYYIAPGLLHNSIWAGAEQVDKSNIIMLPEVADHVGHTIAHYSYTGIFQILDTRLSAPTSTPEGRWLNRAYQVYIAAKEYRIRSLEAKALAEMKDKCLILDFFQIVDAIKDVFSQSPDAQNTFDRFNYVLAAKARVAFYRDYKRFTEPNLFDNVNDLNLSKMLMGIVVRLFSEKLSQQVDSTSSEKLSREDSHSDDKADIDDVVEIEAPTQDVKVDEKLAKADNIDKPDEKSVKAGGIDRADKNSPKKDNPDRPSTPKTEDKETTAARTTASPKGHNGLKSRPPTPISFNFCSENLPSPGKPFLFSNTGWGHYEPQEYDDSKESKAWEAWMKSKEHKNEIHTSQTTKTVPASPLSPPPSPPK